jgi:steroid delta-isomerase-like uncharacterized protein
MSTVTMTSVFEQQLASFNRHDAAAFAACYAPGARVADPQFDEALQGADAVAKDVADWFNAFPDITASHARRVSDGDSYAVEWDMEGTHEGSLVTPEGHVPATGRTVRMTVVTIGRLDADGRIAEERRAYDLAGILSQLGLMQ